MGQLVTRPDDDRLYAFRTNMMVAASAGTGKTFRLASLYVLLTLGLTSMGEDDEVIAAPPVSPSRIAATTFSRAAAAEIRERVERVLRAVAGGHFEPTIEPYRKVIAQRSGLTRGPDLGSPALRERAQIALRELPTSVIDTLHGLAARVVRASALELGVSPAFTILDEEDARASTEEAIEQVLSLALDEGNRAAMDLLDAGGGLAGARARIGELLDRADEEGVDVARLDCPDFGASATILMHELLELCRALVDSGSKNFAEPAVAAARAVASWLDEGATEADLRMALEPLFARRSPPRPLAAEEAFVSYRERIGGESHPDRGRRLAAFAATAGELGPRTQAMRVLLARVVERRTDSRRREGAVGFGDLLRIARDSWRDGGASHSGRAPFDALLVDEFQDTSRVQRDLIYLLRERPALGRARPAGVLPRAIDLEPSGLLLVGDRKQSIYGFRGADVTVFARVAAELVGRQAVDALELGPDFEAAEKPNGTLVSLVENRRSHEDILRFVNWFAAEDFESSAYPFDLRYAKSEHLLPAPDLARDARSLGGRSPRVVVVDDGEEQTEGTPPLVHAASGPMREALVAAGLIDAAVRGAEFGPLAFRDVAVLVRRRATLPLLEFALARYDVPFLVAGRGFFDTPEVRDAGALLRLILDPYDRHALATVLRGPALCLTDTSLLLLSRPGEGLTAPGEWFAAPDAPGEKLAPPERDRLAQFLGTFEKLRSLCLALAPADALRYAVQRLDVDKVFAALPRSAQRLGNLERLIALAARRGGSLPSFVRWLDQQIADQRDESEAAVFSDDDDAVKLLTIHASKGLEFPAVVLLDAGATVRATPLTLALSPEERRRKARLLTRHVRSGGGTMFTPEATEHAREAKARELAERRRLTYVAMTRARERLFVVLPIASPPGSAAATLRRALSIVPHAPGAEVLPAMPYLTRAARAVPELPTTVTPPSPSPAAPSEPHRALLTLSVTPAATFAQCPRRYQLIHEMALEPPSPFPSSTRPQSARDHVRALGTAAHRVLEDWPLSRWGDPTDSAAVLRFLLSDASLVDDEEARAMAGHIARFLAGPYAAHVRADAVAVYREEPFVLEIAGGTTRLRLRGTIDLLAVLEDGSAELIDYKSLAPLHDSGFQLRAYALAASRRYGLRPVRVGIAPLASAPALPELLHVDEAELSAFADRLAVLGDRFVAARALSHFAGIEAPACDALGCGFVRSCHPQRGAR